MPKIQTIRSARFTAQDGRCYYCRQPMCTGDTAAFARRHGISKRQAKQLCVTAEHLVARSQGGDTSMQNIVAACRFCNLTRHKAPRPLSPSAYSKHVQKRLAGGGWHGLSIAVP